MISELNAISFCCEDIKNIENYNEAVSDNQVKWVCKKISDYMRNKYASGEVPWNKGKPMSDELKEKMIAIKRTQESRAKQSQYKKDWWKARRQQNK